MDTAVEKAFSRYGIRDTKLEFRNFSEKVIDGRVYTDDNLKNKITFISFWYAGCLPCVDEFETMNSLYNKYGKRKDFLFLSFAFETEESGLKAANEYHLQYPIICIDRKEASWLMFNMGFPTSVVTDKTGRIRFIKCGGYTIDDRNKIGIDSILSKEIDRVLLSDGG